MSSALFAHRLESYQDWSRCFQDIESWRPLIAEIYRRQGLPLAEISSLTPGTNAVFRIGDAVIKIFAPQETEISALSDASAELIACVEAEALGIPSPAILHHGTIEDRYRFEYVIMEYRQGRELGGAWGDMDEAAKEAALQQVKRIVQALQSGSRYEQGLDYLLRRALENERWLIFNDTVRGEVFRRLRSLQAETLIRVHGDMTGENLLIDAAGSVTLIDFGDSCIAPPEYEYPALIFELFDMDADLVRRFFRFPNAACFLRVVLPAVLLHDFGAHYLRKAAERLLHCAPEDVANLQSLEEALLEHFQ